MSAGKWFVVALAAVVLVTQWRALEKGARLKWSDAAFPMAAAVWVWL